ncbi:TetR/AcrR family transcriptional regulator [Motilibacter deserti]|uniref:TetR/AcrR family transcriptional regulator n=1 Tax=Motilibacter deserti TaxID=2714956 RepID=A0ABX0GZP8_9ACTN|nr:TetR/AcrR family transcriptional regulator [Motilibacter deserti]NHC15059.1 TetR/AcrR family transcriptional regulator [Motilibacter deserti]
MQETAGGRAEQKARTREEIKRAALRRLREGGPGAVSVNALGKEIGLTGPAVYRHFASRDELLTELIVDAYGDLAAELRAAVEAARRRSRPGRVAALAAAYRAWALREPHRYRLLFSAPLPGYDAQSEPLVAASQAAMDVLVELLAAPGPPAPAPPRALGTQLGGWARRRGVGHVEPATALQAVRLWSRLHGLVSLEIEGNFASMGLDVEALLRLEADDVVG